MRIAIVGSGISGLVASHRLHPAHEITLFEARSSLGGHTLTTEIDHGGDRFAIDAGFIVYNEVNYPNLVRLFDELEVVSQPTEMSFSVRCERAGLEYCGSSVRGLFAQPGNLVRPRFWRMLDDIRRFNREVPRLLESDLKDDCLGEVLRRGSYSAAFRDHYLVPMGAAIWSMPPGRLAEAPAAQFLRFLLNHGLLTVRGHHRWRSVVGGSYRYVERLIRPFADRIRLRTPVRRIVRHSHGVDVETDAAEPETFDRVVLATHSDQALRLLANSTPAERRILGAIQFSPNEALLHTDTSVLPTNRSAWASWNYLVPKDDADRVRVTYDMKRLQCLPREAPRFCVSLNMGSRIEEARVLRRFEFRHPVFTAGSVEARSKRAEISGADRIHFCGAYWGDGFHEDGVVSGLAVAREVEREAVELSSDSPIEGPLPAPGRWVRALA